eukprot:scaffold128335_cov14-Tisochrysis_lutea.AAC.2
MGGSGCIGGCQGECVCQQLVCDQGSVTVPRVMRGWKLRRVEEVAAVSARKLLQCVRRCGWVVGGCILHGRRSAGRGLWVGDAGG